MKFTLLTTLVLGAAGLSAQSLTPDIGALWANSIEATINARGELFSPDDETPGFYLHLPGITGLPMARGGGLWIIGRDGLGELTGAVHGYHAQLGLEPGDFVAGPTGTPALNHVWSVSCGNIGTHLADFSDNSVIDNPVPNVYGWPGTGNPDFEDVIPQLGPLPPSEILSGFYDSDWTGSYEPANGDYPAIDLRGCPIELYPNQLVWTVSNDLTNHVVSGLKRLNLELQTEAFAFRSATTTILNNTIFVRYKLIYRGEDPVDSVYVGLWTDFSIADLDDDDYAGTAPAQKMMFGYDLQAGANEAPALGVALLRGPLEHFPASDSIGEATLRHMMIVPERPVQGDAVGFYNLLRGHFADGTPAPNDGVLFPGNPNDPGGTSEASLGTTPGARHGIASYGPLQLLPGAVNELIVAYFYGYSAGADALANVQLLYDSVGVVQAAMQNCFMNLPNDCQPLVEAPVPPAAPPARLFPNPADAVCTLERSGMPFSQVEIIDALGRLQQRLTLSQPAERLQLALGHLPAGCYRVRLDGRQVMPLTLVH